MAVAFQQQIFALDARFNAYRAPNNPNFSKYFDLNNIKTFYINTLSNDYHFTLIQLIYSFYFTISETLYIRRRSQLLRENAKFKVINNYL